MHKMLLALAVAVLASGPLAASDKTDVMAVVHQWVDGFNKGGDLKLALATCADQTSIIDDFPPHERHGAGGCSKWFDDFNAFSKMNEITNPMVSLVKPRHIDITADRAYVVVPASFTCDMKGGADEAERFDLDGYPAEGGSGWRITGSAWSDGTSAAVKTESSGH